MKTDIKIFTVLMLALTTMPGLADTFKKCPNTATGTPPKCKCINNRDEYSEYMNTCAEWISIRGLDEDIGICQKSAGGTRYGHSKAVHHKGKCFVFGDDTISRDPIISLVKKYNEKFNTYKNNPGTLINNQIEFSSAQKLNNWQNNKQPSINALITGYEYFCKKNGANFEFVRQDKDGTAYYVCRGTQSTEQSVQQNTPAPTNTNVKNGSVNTGGTNYSDDGVTLKNYSNKNDFIPFDSDDSTGKKEFLHNLELQYNNDFNVYKNSNQILPTVRFTAPSNLQRAYTSGTVFKGIQDHYEILCNKYVETGDAATMSFSKQGNTFICNIKTCKTGTLKQNRCVQQTNTSTPQTQPKETTTNTTTVESVNNVVKRINGATNVVVGSTIKYPNLEQYNAKDQLFIKDALNNWKNKCKTAIEKVNGSVRAESDYIDADYDSETNSLKCRIKKCRDSNAHIAPDGKSCIANEDKSQKSRSTTPVNVDNASVQPSVQTPDPTVSVEENLDVISSNNSPARQPSEEDQLSALGPDLLVKTNEEATKITSAQDACRQIGGKWVNNGKVSTCTCPNQANGEFWDSETLTCVVEDYDQENLPTQTFNIEDIKTRPDTLPLPKPEGKELDIRLDQSKYLTTARQNNEHTLSLPVSEMTEEIKNALNDWKASCEEIRSEAKEHIGVTKFKSEYTYKNKKLVLKCTPVECQTPEFQLKGKSCTAVLCETADVKQNIKNIKEAIQSMTTSSSISIPTAQIKCLDAEWTKWSAACGEVKNQADTNVIYAAKTNKNLKTKDTTWSCVATKCNNKSLKLKEEQCVCSDSKKTWNGTTCEEKASAADEQAPKENECDDQSNDVNHMITIIDQKLKDESDNDYIEHSISYTSCDTLTKTWTEKCEGINKKAVIETNPDKTLKLTCVPKDDSEVKENNESDFDDIVKAFEKRAKQLKDKNCGQQQ